MYRPKKNVQKQSWCIAYCLSNIVYSWNNQCSSIPMAPTALQNTSIYADLEKPWATRGLGKDNLVFVLTDVCWKFVYDKMYTGMWNNKYPSCDLMWYSMKWASQEKSESLSGLPSRDLAAGAERCGRYWRYFQRWTASFFLHGGVRSPCLQQGRINTKIKAVITIYVIGVAFRPLLRLFPQQQLRQARGLYRLRP